MSKERSMGKPMTRRYSPEEKASCTGPSPADGSPVTSSPGHYAPARRVRSSALSGGAGSSVTLVFGSVRLTAEKGG